MMYRKLVRSPFIPCVHGLRSPYNFRYLLLRKIMILSEIAHYFYILLIHTTPTLFDKIIISNKDIYY